MLWTLIPAKSFRHSKQRLAPVLDEEQRAALSAAMLARTIRTAKAAFGDQPLIVVTPDHAVSQLALEAGADRAIIAEAEGLNPQLAEAAALIPPDDALLVLHADLPLLQPDDLVALASQNAPIVIAPDHTGTGTNALLQRIPDRFFAFGAGSRAKHEREASERGVDPVCIRREGLACDLDDPGDWNRLGLPVAALLDRLTR
ncbi:2-phospho-L-lactate guanylyltransferase [Croceicoccus estronivorus]|uniref:2-phospho-L-lactate guanylyltransferase n=1 Tax=Croceicoccus estronivorus TaxID=1172626 RepID=UPI0008371B4F|nr:2-phospho-L-lactate guanylyltransferase [Croceicoccus estronivorus]OCC25535.1 2-phospho-L-lactate guanylyltransferase [Croceicoccus estronivorus]